MPTISGPLLSAQDRFFLGDIDGVPTDRSIVGKDQSRAAELSMPPSELPIVEQEALTFPPGHTLNLALNSIYNRDFSSFKRIFELSKVFLSSSSAKVKTGTTLQVYLPVALSAIGTTPVIAAGTSLLSFNVLKSSINSLVDSSSSIVQKVVDVVKGTLAAYGLTTGLAVLASYLPSSLIPGFLSTSGALYPTFGAGVLTFVSTQLSDWVLSAVLGLIALSVVQTVLFSGINEIGQGIMKVWTGWSEDKKFEAIYDELGFKSQEEYQEILATEIGFKSFEELAKSGMLNPFIKEGDKNSNPENAFRPLLAMLIVTRRELHGNEEINDDSGEIGKYNQLIAANKLQEAQELLKGAIIPKIFYYTFIRHCMLEPTRPDLGVIKNTSDDKMIYKSYVSQLSKSDLSFPLSAIDIKDIFIEAAKILDAETNVQKTTHLYAMLEQMGGLEHLMKEQSQEAPSDSPFAKKV